MRHVGRNIMLMSFFMAAGILQSIKGAHQQLIVNRVTTGKDGPSASSDGTRLYCFCPKQIMWWVWLNHNLISHSLEHCFNAHVTEHVTTFLKVKLGGPPSVSVSVEIPPRKTNIETVSGAVAHFIIPTMCICSPAHWKNVGITLCVKLKDSTVKLVVASLIGMGRYRSFNLEFLKIPIRYYSDTIFSPRKIKYQ